MQYKYINEPAHQGPHLLKPTPGSENTSPGRETQG